MVIQRQTERHNSLDHLRNIKSQRSWKLLENDPILGVTFILHIDAFEYNVTVDIRF